MRIALIDHHLKNWHADTFLRLLQSGAASDLGDGQPEIVSAWEAEPTPATSDWRETNGIPRADSLEAAVEAADVVMALAPDNIDCHRAFCERVLPFGKPTFLDKFLAPNLGDAQAIVALAERWNTPLLCSSALRYAQELEELLTAVSGPVGEMFSRGMGQWGGYGIHSVSPVVRAMGGGARRLIDTGVPGASVVTLDYGDGRRANIETRACDNGYEVFGWQLGVRDGSQYRVAQVKRFEQFYINQLRAIVAFFASGVPDMRLDEALEIVAILETAARSQAEGNVWVSLTGA